MVTTTTSWTRTIRGKTYADYDKADMANLARARATIHAGSGSEHSAFEPAEADRRVAFYAAQVAARGEITRWLGPVPPKAAKRTRTRFAFGDALGKHGCSA
jgi:hypothetical protein